MAHEPKNNSLGTIFCVFLGLLVTAFLITGLHALYPPPPPVWDEVNEYYRQEQAIRLHRPQSELSEEERAQLEAIALARERLEEAYWDASSRWSQISGASLILLATLLMAVSTARPEQLPVISSGLLLGGLFTMLAGLGRFVLPGPAGTSLTRFLVVTYALIVTLVLGFLRFARRSSRGGEATSSASDSPALAALEERLHHLERQVSEIARRVSPPE